MHSFLMVTAMLLAAQAALAANSAATPVPNSGLGWILRHESINLRVRFSHPDLIYVGDSIVEHFKNQGKAVWQHYYAGRHALNLGISGDRTEHVLWRIDHGNLDGISPKLAIVMIGQNNGGLNTGEEIGEGIAAIVQKMRAKLPATRILLLAIFPRGEKPTPERAVFAVANRIAAQLADNQRVFFMDLNPLFTRPDGSIPASLMDEDFEHPTALGHRVWAEGIESKVAELMGDSPVAPMR